MLPEIVFNWPGWMEGFVNPNEVYPTDEDKVGLAIALARENAVHGTGLPFGAAVFQRGSGRLAGVGVNLVAGHNNSLLHAETVAIMAAQANLSTYALNEEGGEGYELAASSEPCAMCLGAAWYTGISRLVFGNLGEETRRFGFGGGPAIEGSWDGLGRLGLEVKGGVLAGEAIRVLEKYLPGAESAVVHQAE